jgi:type VI secretion system secreted protein Hcp
MATSALLKLDGQIQGWIKGGVTQKGREGLIEVTSWSWGAERNSQAQQPAGPATASEFHITKRRDRGTPLLLNAFRDNERFDEWRFDLYDPSIQGLEVNTMRVELENAYLVSDRYGGVETGTTSAPDHEELTFVFEKITVTWLDGNITGILDLGQES